MLPGSEKRRRELRGKAIKKFSYSFDKNQVSAKMVIIIRLGSEEHTYNKNGRLILPFITKFVHCRE